MEIKKTKKFLNSEFLQVFTSCDDFEMWFNEPFEKLKVGDDEKAEQDRQGCCITLK